MRNADFTLDRNKMIDDQILRRGITERRILDAFLAVPRHLFVPDETQDLAYDDCPLPIGFGQTISQPYIVALMVSELHLSGREKVLEVGTGCGYQTAILAHLAKSIFSIEIIPQLKDRASQTIRNLKFDNIKIILGDGSLGWSNDAPYNAILVSAAAPRIPKPLLNQLADGGRLIVPIGSPGFQRLEVWTRDGSKYFRQVTVPVSFVPLRGKFGWHGD